MNLASPTEVRKLLGDHGIRPSKALGQSFLIDRNILHILVQAAGLSRQDQVLEIGPGFGVVTESLLEAAGRVVAVEKDRRLHAMLVERFRDERRLELILADMLDLDMERMLATGINKVVSNLPYSSGSRMLVNLAMARTPPDAMVITVQQEVAERLAAGPGTRDRGLMSVWIQLVYGVRLIKSVTPTCFWPRPEVGSTIVKLTRGPTCGLTEEERKTFYDLTRHAFMQRRKQLGKILSRLWAPLGPAATAERLVALGIDKAARPEDLTVAEWCALAGAVAG